jgi:hypothetical protein
VHAEDEPPAHLRQVAAVRRPRREPRTRIMCFAEMTAATSSGTTTKCPPPRAGSTTARNVSMRAR